MFGVQVSGFGLPVRAIRAIHAICAIPAIVHNLGGRTGIDWRCSRFTNGEHQYAGSIPAVSITPGIAGYYADRDNEDGV